MKIKARDLLKFSIDDLFEILTGDFSLEFDDGVINTNDKETLYSRFFWEFHIKYPTTPLLMKHHVSNVLKGNALGSKTHMSLLGFVMWDAFNSHPGIDKNQIKDEMARLIYEITNTLYNDLSIRLGEYVTSIDITDFQAITNHEDVKDILNNLTPDQQSIDLAYGSLRKLLGDNTKLQGNPIAHAFKAKLVNDNQVLQCVGPRGFLTDINSLIFPVPVMRGYVKGLRSLHDSFVESRSAAKSLYFSKEPLQETEYFARRLQLLGQVVQNLHEGDCGSTNYQLWHVRKPEIVDGIQVYAGDLKNLQGKYYLDETENKLKVIKPSDTHLIDKTIKIRSVVAGCSHPDPHGICMTCFGELGVAVPDRSNIGHMCTTTMTQQSSQSVLSVKHLDGSSVVDGITLTDYNRRFFKVSKDLMSYMFNEDLKRLHEKTYLIINPAEALGITDVNLVADVQDLTLSRVCELQTVAIKTQTKDAVEITPLQVNVGNRKASFTYEFLNFIKHYQWNLDDKGNYVIDLTGWDYSKSVMTLPQKHQNMADHSA